MLEIYGRRQQILPLAIVSSEISQQVLLHHSWWWLLPPQQYVADIVMKDHLLTHVFLKTIMPTSSVVFETHLSPYTAFILWWMWTYQHHSDARNWITTHRCIIDGSGITLTMYTICSRTFACDANKLLFVHWPVLITLAVTSSYYRALAHMMSHGQISFHHILQYC